MLQMLQKRGVFGMLVLVLEGWEMFVQAEERSAEGRRVQC